MTYTSQEDKLEGAIDNITRNSAMVEGYARKLLKDSKDVSRDAEIIKYLANRGYGAYKIERAIFWTNFVQEKQDNG